uniref:Uncharacterized protein n=1 Tax=Oryza nivara TaxID=4536 RepID=A0A0E0HTB1_ORYNI
MAQLAPRRAQHGVRGDAGGVHPVGDPRRGPAARRRGGDDDVHLPRRARLRHAAAAAGRVPGLRHGLPRRQRLLLPLLLRPRRRRGDRRRGHAPRGAPRHGAPLRRAQPAPGRQAARLQGPLHHRPRRRRRRRPPLRHARRQVPGRQEHRRRRRRRGAGEPVLQLPQGSLVTVALHFRPSH